MVSWGPPTTAKLRKGPRTASSPHWVIKYSLDSQVGSQVPAVFSSLSGPLASAFCTPGAPSPEPLGLNARPSSSLSYITVSKTSTSTAWSLVSAGLGVLPLVLLCLLLWARTHARLGAAPHQHGSYPAKSESLLLPLLPPVTLSLLWAAWCGLTLAHQGRPSPSRRKPTSRHALATAVPGRRGDRGMSGWVEATLHL